jgi:hypothetical protein
MDYHAYDTATATRTRERRVVVVVENGGGCTTKFQKPMKKRENKMSKHAWGVK